MAYVPGTRLSRVRVAVRVCEKLLGPVTATAAGTPEGSPDTVTLNPPDVAVQATVKFTRAVSPAPTAAPKGLVPVTLQLGARPWSSTVCCPWETLANVTVAFVPIGRSDPSSTENT